MAKQKGDGERLRMLMERLGLRCNTMYNDLTGGWNREKDQPAHTRRLKILWADSIVLASNDKKWELVNAIRSEFGDRLISCGLEPDRAYSRDGGLELTGAQNYIVKLKV